MTKDQTRWRQRNGAWERAGDGVYRLAGVARTWRSDLQAALLDAGDMALISHGSAAKLHRFPGFTDSVVEVLIPYGLDHRCTIGTVHECRRFELVTTAEVDGLQVTSPEAALVLLSGSMRLGRLSWLTDELLGDGVVDLGRLEAMHKVLGGRGCAGSRIMRAVIEERKAGPGVAASALERLFDREARRHGFPLGERETPLPGRPNDPCRVDRLVRWAKLIIEIDGRRWHTRVADFERDHQRELDALAAGYRTARVTAWMLRYDAESTFARLRRALSVAA